MKESKTIKSLKREIYGATTYTAKLTDKHVTSSVTYGYDDLISLGNILKKSCCMYNLEEDIHITAYALAAYEEYMRTTDIVALTELYVFLKDYIHDIMEDTNESCIKLCIALMENLEAFLKENYTKLFD